MIVEVILSVTNVVVVAVTKAVTVTTLIEAFEVIEDSISEEVKTILIFFVELQQATMVTGELVLVAA